MRDLPAAAGDPVIFCFLRPGVIPQAFVNRPANDCVVFQLTSLGHPKDKLEAAIEDSWNDRHGPNLTLEAEKSMYIDDLTNKFQSTRDEGVTAASLADYARSIGCNLRIMDQLGNVIESFTPEK